MIKSIGAVSMLLVAASVPALGQGANPAAPESKSRPPSTVLGPTGTMYDGSNAELRLPPERNAYWAQLWADGPLTPPAK